MKWFEPYTKENIYSLEILFDTIMISPIIFLGHDFLVSYNQSSNKQEMNFPHSQERRFHYHRDEYDCVTADPENMIKMIANYVVHLTLTLTRLLVTIVHSPFIAADIAKDTLELISNSLKNNRDAFVHQFQEYSDKKFDNEQGIELKTPNNN